MSFATNIVMARIYEPNIYANFILIMSINVFILGIQSSIITIPYSISLNDYKLTENSRKYFYSSIYFKFIFSLILILIFPLIIIFLPFTFNWPTVILYLIFINAYSFYYFVQDILLSNRLTKQNLINGSVLSFLLILLLLWIYYFENSNLNTYLLSVSVFYLGISFIFFIYNLPFLKLGNCELKMFFSINWFTGKWLLASNFFFHISSQIFPWLLLFQSKKEEIAILGVLMSISNLIYPVLKAIKSYLLPLFVETHDDMLASKIAKWTYFNIMIAIIVVFCGGFFGEKLIEIFFGERYSDLGFIVVLPFINQAINIIFQPIKIAFSSRKRTDIEFWLLLIQGVISLILGIFLVNNFGLIGVFITMIVGTTFYNVSVIYLYKVSRILNT